MEDKNKEQTAQYAECSKMQKETFLYILKALKEQGTNGTEKFINFWEKH